MGLITNIYFCLKLKTDLNLISIIIVNYRGWDSLRLCLDSIVAINGNNLSLDVIIVDNQSNDGELAAFEEKYPKFRFVLNSGNHGFAHGCNTGVKLAKGEYFLFINPDTIVSGKAIQKLLETVKLHSDYYIVSCSQIREDGRVDLPFGFFPSLITLTGFLRWIYKIVNKKRLRRTIYSDSNIIFPDWVSGSVMMITKGNFEKIGGWNERYWLYFEDVDICKRASNAGGKVALIRAAKIKHFHGGASRISPETAALTKTEVLISNHIYIAENIKGINGWAMHVVLIVNNILIGFILAIFGTLIFFSSKFLFYPKHYFLILKYYVNALIRGSWSSPRSMGY